MPKVFVPQQPSKWDEKVGLWIPQVDLRNASRFGDIEIMFPPQASRANFVEVLDVMKRQLENVNGHDCLVALGSPAMIAAAAMIIGKKCGGYVRLLTWDRINRDYSLTEINLS